MFVTSNVLSFKPSATIFSLIFILSFKKDLLLCSKAIFKDVFSKNEIDLRCSLNSSKLSFGIDNCALIPSKATYILPKISNESHLINN